MEGKVERDCCGSSVSVVRASNKETMKATLSQSSSKLPRFHHSQCSKVMESWAEGAGNKAKA